MITIVVLGSASMVEAAVPTTGEIQTALELGQCRSAGDAINRGLDRDEAEAYYYAGFLYDVTNCVAEDPVRAARFYRRAAERGDVRGADALGVAYGLGRGVPQDYVAAYEWLVVRQRRGAPATPVAPETARVAGYAMTVARLARDAAQYPDDARRGDTRASLEALLDVSTGQVVVRHARADIATGSNVARVSLFIDAVTAAYAAALVKAPPLDPRPAGPTVFATPWRFGSIRDDQDRPVLAAGAVSIDATVPVPRP